MFTRRFLADAAERAIKTAAQALLTLLLASGAAFNLLDVDWRQALGIALGAGVISLLTSIASFNFGQPGTASVVVPAGDDHPAR